MSAPHYVPILPAKQGELSALHDLRADLKPAITPLLVVPPIPPGPGADGSERTATQHTMGLGFKIAANWGARRAYLDAGHLSRRFIPDMVPHPIRKVFIQADEGGLRLVPVVTPGQPDTFTAIAADRHRDSGGGVCARIPPGRWPTTQPATRALRDLLGRIGVRPGEVDLVLDMADRVAEPSMTRQLAASYGAVADLDRWRSVTVAGGSFPAGLARYPRGLTRLSRVEWHVYGRLHAFARSRGLRLPDYGDYAVAHPAVPAGPTGPVSISAVLRYTTADGWLVAKGELFSGPGRRGGPGQVMAPVARRVQYAPQFAGAGFSAGDAWISRAAAGRATGNPTTWRQVGTDHHLTLVSRTLAAFG